MSSSSSLVEVHDTLCPVCLESIHDEKPVAVATGCGHIYHQECTRVAGSKLQNCWICNEPTKSFVDLFIRLPNNNAVGSVRRSKDLVTKLEHEFHTVSRRTQLSLEKEVARREFEQTWLQEERQLSVSARERVEKRHAKAIQTLESNLKELQVNYERKLKTIEKRKKQRRRSLNRAINHHQNQSSNENDNPLLHLSSSSLPSMRTEGLLDTPSNQPFMGDTEEHRGGELATSTHLSQNDSFPGAISNDVFSSTAMDESNAETLEVQDVTTTTAESVQATDSGANAWSPQLDDDATCSSSAGRRVSFQASALPNEKTCADDDDEPRTVRPDQTYSREDSDYNLDADQKPPPSFSPGKSVPNCKMFSPTIAALQPAPAVASASTTLDEDRKLPATSSQQSMSSDTPQQQQQQPPISRKRKGQTATCTVCDDSSMEDATIASVVLSVADYERQRLEAETAYFQHQAELVELERHQAEIELEQDELALQRREQRIRLERSRLEESFTSIQRRVEESKQEAKDRQKLTAMEEKFAKYKVARVKEDERFQQELDHLKQDDVHISERETWEKRRQEHEKVRLRKEINQLVKVMNELERAKELVKVAEEQSSSSQTPECCVVCFEPLVNEESELGVAVPCGHSFHYQCFAGWEKSKRKRGASFVPCPLCNVGASLCVSIRMTRPASSSMYYSSSSTTTSSSSLARHFQKEEGRWQRRRLAGSGLATDTFS